MLIVQIFFFFPLLFVLSSSRGGVARYVASRRCQGCSGTYDVHVATCTKQARKYTHQFRMPSRGSSRWASICIQPLIFLEQAIHIQEPAKAAAREK